MATNYPTSLDAFVNPTTSDSLNSPSHSLQHANANDAIEAIETKVGFGAAPAGSAATGAVLVASTGGTTSWTTVGTASINSTGGTVGYALTAGSANVTSWQPSGAFIPVATGGTVAYTFGSADQGKILEFNGTFTVTVPPEATFNYSTGSVLNLLNVGTGTITIAGGTAVTVNGNPGLKLSSQWSGASIVKRSSNTWVAVGDLSA
jgi:hypothetical protein